MEIKEMYNFYVFIVMTAIVIKNVFKNIFSENFSWWKGSLSFVYFALLICIFLEQELPYFLNPGWLENIAKSHPDLELMEAFRIIFILGSSGIVALFQLGLWHMMRDFKSKFKKKFMV